MPLTTEQKKFWKWLTARRKVMGQLWKQIAHEARLGKSTLHRIKHAEEVHVHSRDRFAIALGFTDWRDLLIAYQSGVEPTDRMPHRAKDAGITISPSRMADQLARLCQADAAKYRTQMFQNLTPSTVAEVAKVFNDQLNFYMKGKS